ncbi:MAG: hypothetical protein RLZZ598_2036 [Pseudomonadota bacterium]|jgi:hypothetical protein
MADTPKDWPLAFKPAEQSFYIQTLASRFTNPFTGHVQVLERDGARWMSRLRLQLSGREARAFDAFLASLRGSAVEVLLPDFRRLAALGSLAGTPVLAAGTGRTLTLSGFTANATAVLKAGDLLQTSPGRGHLVVEDVTADASGAATVRIEPRLREAVTVGPLITNTVRVRMRLLSDDAGRNPTTPPVKSVYSIDLFEALPTS